MGIDRAYICRMLNLTLLAPDIVDAIVAGTEPDGLSVVRLWKPLPRSWPAQRRQLGFPPVPGDESSASAVG